VVWRKELEGQMGKEEKKLLNTCVQGCCSNTQIPLAIPKPTSTSLRKSSKVMYICLSMKGFPNYYKFYYST
jgi:hypothetical protein